MVGPRRASADAQAVGRHSTAITRSNGRGEREEGMAGLIRVLLIGLAIPALGFAVAAWVISDVNADLAKEGLPTIQEICGLEAAQSQQEVREACAEFAPIGLLRTASVYAGLFGLVIPVLFWLGSLVAGKSRPRIAIVFPALVRISVVLLSLMVLAQGAILTYATYLGESYLVGRVHIFVIGAIGIGALVGAIGLISASASLGQKLQTQVIGKRLRQQDAPKLYAFVRSLAEKLRARPPENIIIGLDPNFFVTSADVALIGAGETLRGETLFVSAPLSRLLSQREFAAVIGHELGHFRGGDTEYSMKFAPVYAGLGSAINALASKEDEGAAALAKLPAISILSYMLEVFASNERTIGRDRELIADQAGAEASSPADLATALVKVSLYSGLWDHARSKNVERLNQGKIARNLSSVFQDITKYDVEHDSLEQIKAQVLEKRIAHPTDTHPPTSERLSALGVSPADISKSMLLIAESPAIELLEGHAAVEEELTLVEHKLMVALGLVSVPNEKEREENYVLRATYALAAAMVGADGRVAPEEIAIAEGIGSRLLEDFDSVEFREVCNNLHEVPDVQALSELLANVLEDEHKSLILRYLNAIAGADGEVSPEERSLLERISATLGVSLEQASGGAEAE
jgi:Zn-dependent protease with chaperone function/tellurite resistance protein